TRLDLRSNDIGGKGGEALFENLLENQTLTSLDLSGLSGINRNHIGVRGASMLSKLLSVNRILYDLNLGSNGLGVEGIKLLCKGLKDNHAIRVLDISSNNIGAHGCELLAKVFEHCKLRKLVMERNQIGDAGAIALSD